MSSVALKDQILYASTGSTLSFEAPQGRPSSDGTVTLYDPRYARTDTARNPIGGSSGTAARKAVSTTLTGAAGASQTDPKSVPCTPPAVLRVGDYVWLTNASRQAERRRVAAIGTTTITVDYPLAWDYATGAALESAEMTSPAISSSWAADVTNVGDDYEAEWVYTVDGKTYTVVTRWDLVREVVDLWIQDSDLFEFFPDARRFTFANSPDGFADQRRAAQRVVTAFLQGRGLDPDRIRGTELCKLLVALQTLVRLADNEVSPGSDAASYFTRRLEEYEKLCADVTSGALKFPYDADEDSILDSGEVAFVQPMLVR